VLSTIDLWFDFVPGFYRQPFRNKETYFFFMS
jgi:hypothetical protein